MIKFEYDFPMAAVTSTLAITAGDLILLGKRSDNADAFPGVWGLPGGFLNVGTETVAECASRELKEECNIDIAARRLKFLMLDDTPDGTDCRYDHVVNMCYTADLQDFPCVYSKMKAGDDIQELKWVSMFEACDMKLAFQHNMIVEAAKRLYLMA